MEIFQLICVALWMASSLVYASNQNPKIPSADIIFQAYEFQFGLSVEQIQETEPSKLNLDNKFEVLSKTIDKMSQVLSLILESDVENETQSNSTRSTIKAVASEIFHYREINNQFRLQALVKSLESSIQVSNTSEINALDAETVLVEIIETFANGESPFYRYPAIAVPTLISLASFTETFLEILNKQNNSLANETSVACDLADTIHNYFKPTLIDRFIEIDINTDYNRFVENNKYVFIERISNQPFYLNGFKDFVRCIQGDGGKKQYLNEKSTFTTTKAFKSKVLNFMDPNLLIESVNTDKFNFSLIKDSLGVVDEFYHDEDVKHGPCALDYFSLVRQRLESEFGQAYVKVVRLCKTNFRKKEPTGFGWLHVQVGSVLAERLEDGRACDINTVIYPNRPGTILNSFCEPYVKMTVNYEHDGKRMKIEHKTDVKKHASGWTPFDETFHFDRISNSSSIDIEILNNNDQTIFSKTLTVSSLVNDILFQNSYSKLFMISTWRDENL